ncbi:MAG: carbohydrate ABC transporter permease [Clostridia bacterium]|nr:carbohydrate ABC transporter permease [Clostridia bacterium]
MKKNASLKDKKSVFIILIGILLAIYALTFIALFAWGVFTSLKDRSDFYVNKVWLPNGWPWEWEWGNYPYVLENFFVLLVDEQGNKYKYGIDFQVMYTLIYAIGGAFLQAIVPCLVAYVAQKWDNLFSKILYTAVIVTMIIPIIGSNASMMVLMKQLGLYDNFFGVYLMQSSFTGFYFLTYYGVFKGMAKEYSEAAVIDGANEYRVLFSIMLPLIKSTFATIFLIKFIELWNDYQTPLLWLPMHPTLAFGVYNMSLSTEQGLSSTPMRLACCMITALPILALFIAFRNQIMGNLTMGGVKE